MPGSNSGTGYATALELAKSDATVVMICRNESKGIAAQKEIIKISRNKNVELIIADLAEMDQVCHAANEFKSKHKRLDVLVNNAGGLTPERQVNSQGIEKMFAGNYLGHFLLTTLLLDEIVASTPARIINVSSIAHVNATIDFDDLQGSSSSNKGGYGQSKLAQVLFTYELARQLQETGVTVNVLHPGAVSSGFKNGVTGASRVLAGLIYKIMGISPEKGAETILYLSTSPEVENITGKYFVKCKEKQSSKLSYDVVLQRRLWEESERLLQQSLKIYRGRLE